MAPPAPDETPTATTRTPPADPETTRLVPACGWVASERLHVVSAAGATPHHSQTLKPADWSVLPAAFEDLASAADVSGTLAQVLPLALRAVEAAARSTRPGNVVNDLGILPGQVRQDSEVAVAAMAPPAPDETPTATTRTPPADPETTRLVPACGWVASERLPVVYAAGATQHHSQTLKPADWSVLPAAFEDLASAADVSGTLAQVLPLGLRAVEAAARSTRPGNVVNDLGILPGQVRQDSEVAVALERPLVAMENPTPSQQRRI
mmetsp:Transcript_41069/g.92690  ORF Transcript_41069/g.92690 Transcript_41069/m.92690 type:complete len:265 (+) Transcript_41069:394-1188(+)